MIYFHSFKKTYETKVVTVNQGTAGQVKTEERVTKKVEIKEQPTVVIVQTEKDKKKGGKKKL